MKVTLADKLAQVATHWDPHVVADYNGNDVMVVKFSGAFDFHKHDDSDDFFLILKGKVVMDYEDGRRDVLRPGDLCVVPAGRVHRPRCDDGEAEVLLIEPKGLPNTGDPATAARKPRL